MSEERYAQAIKYLRRFYEYFADEVYVAGEDCRLDHHGYCQTHFLEKDCTVAATGEFLLEVEAQEKGSVPMRYSSNFSQPTTPSNS